MPTVDRKAPQKPDFRACWALLGASMHEDNGARLCAIMSEIIDRLCPR
jgi:hypothetical protein